MTDLAALVANLSQPDQGLVEAKEKIQTAANEGVFDLVSPMGFYVAVKMDTIEKTHKFATDEGDEKEILLYNLLKIFLSLFFQPIKRRRVMSVVRI